MEWETLTIKFILKFLTRLAYKGTSTDLINVFAFSIEKIFGLKKRVFVKWSQVCIAQFHQRNWNNNMNGKYHI